MPCMCMIPLWPLLFRSNAAPHHAVADYILHFFNPTLPPSLPASVPHFYPQTAVRPHSSNINFSTTARRPTEI